MIAVPTVEQDIDTYNLPLMRLDRNYKQLSLKEMGERSPKREERDISTTTAAKSKRKEKPKERHR